MRTLYIIDVDATLTDATRRIRFAGPEPSRDHRPTYEAWADRINYGMEHDLPVPGMRSLIKAIADDINNRVVFLTSREEEYRDVTEQWLTEHNFPEWAQLVMRPTNNYQDTAEFKHQEIKRIAAFMDYEAVVVIDDDHNGTLEQLCDQEGWTFLKARSGGVAK